MKNSFCFRLRVLVGLSADESEAKRGPKLSGQSHEEILGSLRPYGAGGFVETYSQDSILGYYLLPSSGRGCGGGTVEGEK